jgi:hypothetical protein
VAFGPEGAATVKSASGLARAWFGVACDLHASPGMVRLRRAAGEYADVLFYRAIGWCKQYEHTGQIAGHWRDLADFVGWDGTPDDLRALFISCGLADGDRDLLYDWEAVNGWIIERAQRERRRAAKNRRKEAADEARKERIAAQRRKVAQSGRKEGRKEGLGGGTRTARVRYAYGIRNRKPERKGSK